MEFLQTAVDAVRQAGNLVCSRAGSESPIDFKGAIDPVTEMDRKSERVITALIRTRHPDHDLVAEEGSSVETSSRYRWLIDPLDGTVNYSHDLPWFSVSAALLVDGVTEAGAVYLPISDELFAASRGGGATLNGTSINVSQESNLNRGLLATGFPYDVRDRTDEILAYLGRFLKRGQGVRRVGSAAMDLCYLACGRYDGYWELGLHAWDVAAGILIVREAGGRVSDFSGVERDVIYERIVASNGHLHPEMLTVIQGGADRPSLRSVKSPPRRRQAPVSDTPK